MLAAIPAGYRALVVDNNSTDDTAEVARRHGADVVHEAGRRIRVGRARRGGGRDDADRRGASTATARWIPAICRGWSPTLERGADLVVGRRRPVRGCAGRGTPGSATRRCAGGCAASTGWRVHDIAPMRVARRDALLALGVTDRRSGYPLELLVRAAAAGWRWWSSTSTTARAPAASRRSAGRCGAVSSPRSTSGRPSRDRSVAVPVTVLVVAKAPVPGLAKTRLARDARRPTPPPTSPRRRCWTPSTRWPRRRSRPASSRSTGDLDAACRAGEIRARLADFTVIDQRGDDFAERLANAHADAAAAGTGPVLQIGMDTPQVSADLLDECARALLTRAGRARHGRATAAGGCWASRSPRPGGLPARRADVACRHRRCNACRVARHWSRCDAASGTARRRHRRRHRRPSARRARPTAGSSRPPVSGV